MSVLAGARALPMWRALGIRDFRLLWASEAISVIGDQFHYVALAWLVIDLTQSGLALGTILIAIGVPRALMLLPFGVLADRRPPQSLMLAAHVARGVIVGAIAALVMTDAATLPLLAVLGALFGAADAMYLPAQQAFLPRTLEAGRLPSANALLQGTLQLASIAGPPIAGAAIVLVGTGPAFAIDSASFFAAAFVVMLIATPRNAPAPGGSEADDQTARDHPSFVSAVREGVAYVVADPPLRTTLLLSLVLNLALNGPAAVGMPWLAEVRFDAGPAGLGLMAAAWAAGALVGTVAAGNVRVRRQGLVLLASVAVAGVAMMVVGGAEGMPIVVLALAVMGVAIGYVNIVAISWMQARVTTDMVGRVMSLAMLMGFGITPISLGLAGALIDVNATALFVGAGALVLLATAAALAVNYPASFDRVPSAAQEGAAATQ